MASKVRLVRFTWENGVSCKVDTKLDNASYITIIDVDENGHLNKLWDAGLKTVIMTFLEAEVDTIGEEMKA